MLLLISTSGLPFSGDIEIGQQARGVFIVQKKCSKCKEFKPATPEYFHRDSNKLDGLNAKCKVCVKEYQQSNHPKMVEAAYRWRDANPEKFQSSQEEWKEKNRDKLIGYSRSYRLADPEKYRQNCRNWRAANREKSRQAASQWTKNNPIRNAIKTARRKARIYESEGTYTEAEWLELCARYDNRCLCCKEQKPLTVDHVVPVTRGGRNDVSNLQPLCQECNSRKGQKTIDYR